MNNTISSSGPVPAPYSAEISKPATQTDGEPGFGEVFRASMKEVEQLNGNAEQQASELLQGDRSDVQNVMIAIEKADVAFQLMMQVRNKIVNAYQQVSQMQF